MKLFQPNNLSKLRPEFAPLNDQKITQEIVSLLRDHYDIRADVSVSVFSGANISSQNFKIETPLTKVFLKSRDKSVAEKMRSEAKLTSALSDLGQKAPRIICAQNGDLVSSHEDKCWVLYEFQEGDYFTGKGNELQAAAESFAELALAATQLFPVTHSEEEPVPLGLAQLLDRARRETTRYPDVAELCATHSSMILENLIQVNEHQRLLAQPCVAMHLDYHPLNLLMKDERVVCIVDLEHLKPYPVAVGLGFAGFKLIRQAMVDPKFRERELSNRSAVSTWLRGWQKSFPADRFTTTELGLGARCRILKLIYLILDAALNHNDARSNYDLEKQITSLFEADVVFERGFTQIPTDDTFH